MESTKNDTVESILSARAKDLAGQNEKLSKLKILFSNISRGKNDSINRRYLSSIVLQFYNAKKWKDFKLSSDVLLKLSEQANDTSTLASGTRYRAAYYKNNGIYDSAFYYYLKSEKFFRALKNNAEVGNILINKSIVQFYASDYIGADRSATVAYTMLKDSRDSKKLYEVYTMLGIVSSELKDYPKALEYYRKAYDIVKDKKVDSQHELATCYNNIGYVYQDSENYQEAIINYKMGLKDSNLESEMPDLYSLLLDNMAYCQFKLGINRDLPGLFYKSLKVRQRIEARTLIVLSKIHLSEYYGSIGNIVLSQKFSDDALTLSYRTGNPRDILASLKQSASSNPEKSSGFQKDYIRISDSIQQVESNSKQKFARLQLETDDIQSQNKKLASQNRNLIYFFAATIFIGLLLFVIRSQRARNRELLVKQAQQKANEDIYNLMISQQSLVDESRVQEKQRIAQELHDGVLGRLFGARMNLDSLNRQNDDEAMKNRLNYIAELKNIEQDIREISHDLSREKVALIHNFTAIVSNLIEEQQSSFPADISVSFDSTISWQSLSNVAKINLYRILQESLQNINKYAVAKHIVVRFDKHNETIMLSIIDDGAGFEVNQRRKGIGLQNMLSRVSECGGILDIKSKKGKGTAITVTIPVVSLPALADERS